jgi:hypothetical protein
VAGPPSPAKPCSPVPATVLISAVWADRADAVVERVGDEQRASGREGDAVRQVELRVGPAAALAREARGAGAGDRRDVPVRPDASDGVGEGVREHEAAAGSDRDPARMVDLCRRRRPAVAALPEDAGADDRRDRRGRPRGGRHASGRGERPDDQRQESDTSRGHV